ncbi:MAG: hypothetical protein HBSAPP03_21480 [Phycisphaerae bacterium]|nr:MAG: hypothetical protein HBSAPP03_21480 [Phycisphaerae bacterium]
MLAPARRWLLPILALACLLPLQARGQEKDRWYTLDMMGGKVGWMHAAESREGDRITTRSRMSISIARADGQASMSMESEFVETAAGEPVSMKRVQKFGTEAVTISYTFTKSVIEVTTTQGGTTSTSTAPLPEGAWLTPAAAERYSLQRFKSGAKEISVRTLAPETGPTPVTLTRKGFEKTTLEVMGRSLDAFKVTSENTAMPGSVSTEWIDAEGELLRTETPLGATPIVMVRSTREEALAKSAAPSPDVMAHTLIKSDKPIPNAARLRKAVYLVSVAEGELPDLPETGTQRIQRLDAKSARVTVTASPTTPAPQADLTDPAYTRATPLCDSNDVKIKELAAQAAKDRAGAALAEACRAFVNRYIHDKNMDVGFATASEVARTRSGDCSEHGVLLAALLRANGIPARAAAGLVYVPELSGQKHVFGYHMWAQALIDLDGVKQWVDLDGTLRTHAYDPSHLTLALSPLDDSDPSGGMVGVAAFMGRLRISVESTE